MSADARRDVASDSRQTSRVVALIPARYDYTRFPGKALADLCGKPMIVHVYERARQARGVDEVIVATDDRRIADAVTTFGGVARLTSSEHRTGTDRIAEVARDLACDIVVNPQGDEPLLDPRMIEDVVRPLLGRPRRVDDHAAPPDRRPGRLLQPARRQGDG